MSKYIIKNCPAIYSDEYCKENTYEDGSILCQDCTDCLLKKIVEKCKRTQTMCKGMESEFTLGKLTYADFILSDFDIEEVE